MDRYVTGAMIRRLREERNITQQQLSEKLKVSDKTISKWETGRGYPDITLIEPLASALGVSVIELFSGSDVVNENRAANMLRTCFYVCPVCGNLILSTGETVVSCCGITLPALEPEEPDDEHRPKIEPVEDEYYVSMSHEMTKQHHIAFIAAIKDDGYELRKLYPEMAADGRFKIAGTRAICCLCNHHGLFRVDPRA